MIAITMTVEVEDEERAAQVHESIARVTIGFALDGHATYSSVLRREEEFRIIEVADEHGHTEED